MRLQDYLNEGIKEHLKERDFSESFPVFIDTEGDVAYFPLFNLSGKMVGYQRYNPKGIKGKDSYKVPTEERKYYSYITKENPEKNIPHIAVYGLHTLDKRPFVFIVEGVFDAAKLMNLNLPVIAVMANDPKPLKNFFFVLQKDTIAWIDNDEAGRKLKRIAKYSITTPKPYKDLGDMPLEEVEKVLKDKGFLKD